MNATYAFRIDVWKPTTLPLARLAEYLSKLAILFGNAEYVHFIRIRKGSAVPVLMVDEPAIPKVEDRLRLASNLDAPEDISRVHHEINRMLRDDNAVGTLRVKGGGKVLYFPGRKTQIVEEAVVHDFGELDGVVIRVGGKDESVPVTLEGVEGVYYRCNTSREMARKLAGYLFGQTVRVAGRGKWRRTQDGTWEQEAFIIESFQTLDEMSLGDVVAEMRKVEGSGWNDVEDPQSELRRLRGE